MNDTENKQASKREVTRRELFKMVVPRGVFPLKGHLKIDKSRCSACTLCAQECLTGALTIEGDESVNLIFRHEMCDSCGLCVRVCPEDCLTLENGAGETSPVILFEDEFVHCTNCGVVIGSKAMIERVRSKLGSNDNLLVRKLQLCPVCKGKKG